MGEGGGWEGVPAFVADVAFVAVEKKFDCF